MKVGDEPPIVQGYDFEEAAAGDGTATHDAFASLQPWPPVVRSVRWHRHREREAVAVAARRIADQIDRTGLVAAWARSASVSIWEEAINSARDAGGPKGAGGFGATSLARRFSHASSKCSIDWAGPAPFDGCG